MGRQYRYFAIADYKPTGNTWDVLRRHEGGEELFVPAEGWLPSTPRERRGVAEREIDEREAWDLVDENVHNRFMPLDRPFRYFALVDGEHPVEQPLAVVRRWHDGTDEREEAYVLPGRWVAGTRPRHDTAVPVDAAAVDRFASIMWERANGIPFYHYIAIVDDEHTVDNPRTVVRERPATGESETYTENLDWEPGTAEGRRVPVGLIATIKFRDTMAERVRELRPYRYYAIVTDEHPDVAAPAALVRQHICARCLPSDEVYRANGRWVKTNAVIAIRAGERPGKAVPIAGEAAAALRETWTPRPFLDSEPVSLPLFRYYAVVSDGHPEDDPLTVVRVLGDTEEAYTPVLRWEEAETPGERVEISAVAALRFEETRFRRAFGSAEFRYYAAVNAFHPDPDDPAAVVRDVIDDLTVWGKEVHGPGHQWTYVPEPDGRKLVAVTAEKAARLREVCDSRPAEPLWYYRLLTVGPDVREVLSRSRNDRGAIRREHFRNGRWEWTFTSAEVPSGSATSAHYEHPADLDAVRRFEAEGNYDPPPPPEPDYTYSVLYDPYSKQPALVRGLLRTSQRRRHVEDEQFDQYDGTWSTTWVRDDISRDRKDYDIVGISEEEALRVRQKLVDQVEHARALQEAQTYYAVVDAEHTLRNPLAYFRVWPEGDVEMVEEYVRDSGHVSWQVRNDRPAGHAVELTESSRRRMESRDFRRVLFQGKAGGTA